MEVMEKKNKEQMKSLQSKREYIKDKAKAARL